MIFRIWQNHSIFNRVDAKDYGESERINTDDVVALSEGTTMVKRYIEFICLREVEVPQFLLDTLNNLEKL